jgi:predicted dehydrogenase/threonine dehydrogenase-like Zn-dependent dehydrogenase
MIQAIVKKGKVIGEIVPTPYVSDKSVLIKVVNSCISPGTELSGINNSGKPLMKKALEQPEKISKVLNWIKNDGVNIAIHKYKSEINIGNSTGYSVSGIVVGIGKDVKGFNLGDKVAACGGSANHAEYVDIPINLVVKIPAGLDFKSASSVAIGAIALQGVRRADLKVGEFAVVLGAGLIGLLTLQILKASGVRVAAIDIEKERLNLADKLGSEITILASGEDAIQKINNWTGGFGVDAVLFTAATKSSQALSDSFNMCKRKGRVVLVGVSGTAIDRKDVYPKEIDFLISTSYGPGRYDNRYEQEGIDYPYGYVRWTENRNMQDYLRMIKNGQILFNDLISNIYSATEIPLAFESFKYDSNKPLCVLLDYGIPKELQTDTVITSSRIMIHGKLKSNGRVNVAVVGVGSFAKSIHLPNLIKLKDKFNIHCIMDKAGNIAKGIAELYHASYITSNYEDIITDPDVDLILICTRHASHAEFVIKALKAGKHVFVEKPLATSMEQLKLIEDFYASNIEEKPLVTVGYNRRYSPYINEIRKVTSKRINPLIIQYRMNAGRLPKDHWVFSEGGRIIGEACHIIDLMTSLTGSQIQTIGTDTLNPSNDFYNQDDNRIILLKYQDGSVASISYFANGSKQLPKEYMEVHVDGKSIILDDYKSLRAFGIKIKEINTLVSEKGHLQELEAIYESLSGKNNAWPIELWDLIQTSQISLEITR